MIVYLKLAQNMHNAYIEEHRDEVLIEDEHGEKKRVLMDMVVFVRA